MKILPVRRWFHFSLCDKGVINYRNHSEFIPSPCLHSQSRYWLEAKWRHSIMGNWVWLTYAVHGLRSTGTSRLQERRHGGRCDNQTLTRETSDPSGALIKHTATSEGLAHRWAVTSVHFTEPEEYAAARVKNSGSGHQVVMLCLNWTQTQGF